VKLGLFCLFASLASAQSESWRVVDSWPQLPSGFAFKQVSGVAVDSKDNVWVFHRDNANPLLCFEGTTGKLIKIIGKGIVENAHGLTIDAQDNLWITDVNRHQVIKLDQDGRILLTLGEKGVPAWDATHFNRPTMVAFSPNGELLIGDGYGNSRIARFTPAGKYLGEWGKKGTGPGEFDIPHSINFDKSGNIYVCDRANRRIQIFTPQGKYLREWKNEELGRPWAMVTAADGTFYMVDGGDEAHGGKVQRSRILHLTPDGKKISEFGSFGKAKGQMIWPHDIALGPDGVVYIGEVQEGQRVQKFVRVRR
jgi:sugar lactone lactonase YvrE